MKFLLILLLFCPLVFSEESPILVELFEGVDEAEQTWKGSMNDFNDEKAELHPIKCFNEINKEYMDYSYLNASVVSYIEKYQIKKCVSELASLNPKVKKIENQLVEQLSDAFAYLKNDAVNCVDGLRSVLDTECLNTMSKKSGADFCDKMWGKDGCTVKYRIEYCGSNYMIRLRDSLTFLDQGHEKCVDKYYPY